MLITRVTMFSTLRPTPESNLTVSTTYAVILKIKLMPIYVKRMLRGMKTFMMKSAPIAKWFQIFVKL